MSRLLTTLFLSSIICFWTSAVSDASERLPFEKKLPLENGFSKNKSTVYYKGRSIENSDPSTFIVLDYRYAKDANQAYYLSHSGDPSVYKDKLLGELHGMLFPKYKLNIIKVADPETFVSLPYDSGAAIWAIDKNNVYWCGKLFDDADPGSFEIINGPGLFAKDKLQFYDGRGYWPTALQDLPKPKTPSMYPHKDDK
jgi:hypothetical protein